MIIHRTQINTSQVTSGVGDEVIAFAPMPEGSKLLNVSGELHVIGSEARSSKQFVGYGFGGEFIPETDPDTTNTMDQMWDKYVTKSVVATTSHSTTTVDFDWDSADTTVFVEPGELDINDIAGLQNPTREIFAPRLELLSFAKGAPVGIAEATPDTYTPRDFKTFNSSRGLVADQDGWAMLALAVPAFDQRTTADPETFGDVNHGARQWAILRNLRSALNDFWRINTGMIEQGAESPYDYISTAIQQLVTPTMYDDLNAFSACTFTYLCKTNFVMDYPDDSIPNVIKAQF